jgi:hypothetical protein
MDAAKTINDIDISVAKRYPDDAQMASLSPQEYFSYAERLNGVEELSVEFKK